MWGEWSPLERLIWLHIVLGGGGGGVSETVSGVSPLSLVNALAKPIKKIIQYGKVTTSDGKTYCNNGEMVAVHRSGLPRGYTLLDSVGSGGSAYVLTDFRIASTDVIESEFRNSSSTGYGALYGVFRLGDSSAFYANQTYYGYDEANNKVNSDVLVDTDWHSVRHDFANGTLTVDDVTVTFEPFEFVNDVENAIFARSYNNSYGYVFKGYIRKFKVTRSNEVVCDLLPCKNEQNVAGLYDVVNGTFYAPTGGNLLEGNAVDDYDFAVEGTPEVLTVGEQTATVENLLAVDDIKDEQNIISGTVTRRCEAVISDGTTPSGRYIGEVGEGNIIVKVRETGYEGDVATFEADRAKPLNGLIVNVEPIQDLHGYDSPWPAGGGKNLWDYSDVVSGTNFSVTLNPDNSITITGIPDSNYQNLTSKIDITDILEDGTQYTLWMSSYTDLNNICYPQIVGERADTTKTYITANGRDKTFQVDKSTFVKYTIYLTAGSIANWGASRTITEFLQLEKGSSKTSFAPYSNICPISGRTSATVTRTGKNLFDINTIRSTVHGMTVTIDGQTVKVDGTSSVSGRATLAEFQFLKAGTYHLHTSGDLLWLKAWSSLGADATVTVDDISVVYRLATATLTSGTEYHLTATENQIEIGSSFSAYEPYAGNTYAITLGDTVYGGTLDVTAGKLTATMAMVDLGTLTWYVPSDSYRFRAVLQNPKQVSAGSIKGNMLCSSYATLTANQTYLKVEGISLQQNTNDIYVYDAQKESMTVAAFKAAMSGVQLCYELATPLEIALTPTQIETLIGQNNVWSDAGAVKAYVADSALIEHVTSQPMRTAEGDNTVSVTSAVDPVQLEVEYVKAKD